jgi:uncharacterized cupin superfamily protein
MTTRPAIDPQAVAVKTGSSYPEPFASQVGARRKRALGDALGLTNYGVNLVELAPGALSSMRHWHSRQDEFVYVLEGELTLITDAGEQILSAGMAAGYPAGSGDAHQMVNRSDALARYLEVGDRIAGDAVVYPDIDLALADNDTDNFTHKDGTPY